MVENNHASGKNRSNLFFDFCAGGSLGLLLGILVGLASTPIVASVVTGLVALLAGLFGFSEKISPEFPANAACRLIGFGLTAAIATPFAVFVRTANLLAPSVEATRATLLAIGVTDPREQMQELLYLRYGAGIPNPAGGALAKSDINPSAGVLFGGPAGFCDSLARIAGDSPVDLLNLLREQSEPLHGIGARLGALPEDQKEAAARSAKFYLCAIK